MSLKRSLPVIAKTWQTFFKFCDIGFSSITNPNKQVAHVERIVGSE